MAENLSSGVTKYQIDTRYDFVQEHLGDESIKIVFAKSSDNDVDIFTKNVGKEAYEQYDS
jgi:hypothetical protein